MEESRKFINGFLEEVGVILADRNIKKKDLADRMGIRAPHLIRVLSGQKMPNIDFLVKLQKALGVKIDLRVLDVRCETIEPEIKMGPVKSLEVTLDSSWAEKSEYCKRHGISMSELDKRLRSQ